MRVGLQFAMLILAGAACSSLGLNFKEPDIQLYPPLTRIGTVAIPAVGPS